MTLVTRYHGFTLHPTFVAHGPSSPVSIAIDETRLTLWVGDPSNVWQTPLSELHQLSVLVGRRLTIGFTVAGVRYSLRARRREEHDTLVELLRAKGASVVQARAARSATVLSVALVVVAASAASIVSVFHTSSALTGAQLDAINVQRGDLPSGFSASANDLLTVLVGNAHHVIRNLNTTTTTSNSRGDKIFRAVTKNYESCMHETHASDRLFGLAGVIPSFEVGGSVFHSSANNGTAIGSYAQYYATTKMVSDDIAQYSSPRFGKCFAQSNAQIIFSALEGKVAAANTVFPLANYTPFTVAHGWRRGGVATIALPHTHQTISMISVLAAQGHEEVAYFAIVGNATTAQPVVTSAFEAVLARLEPSTSSGSA